MLEAIAQPGVRIARSVHLDRLFAPGPSLFDALYPSATMVHRFAVSLALVGVLVGLARARFFLPDNPVPITFQTFGVLLIGGVMGWRWGLFSILVYYFLGMAGVPVFQGGGNGWAYVGEGVTGGYLIGFIASAALVGYLSQRGWNRGRSLWPMILAMLVVYVPGLLWLYFGDFGWPADGELFSAGMYPFIPGDLVKAMMAAIAVGVGWRLADSRQEDRDGLMPDEKEGSAGS